MWSKRPGNKRLDQRIQVSDFVWRKQGIVNTFALLKDLHTCRTARSAFQSRHWVKPRFLELLELLVGKLQDFCITHRRLTAGQQ
ncbi:hypothetical protein GCM10025785_05310 [Corynebacterium canis]